ncbi:MAG: alpha-glucosidase C-terminal domain-containing protein, partial [Terrimicrobiaceae bacterium]
LQTPGNTLAFVRELGTESIVAAFNLAPEPASIETPSDSTVTPLEGHGFIKTISEGRIQLPPYGAFFGASRRTGD